MPEGSAANMFAIFPISQKFPIKSQSMEVDQKCVPAEGVEEFWGGLVLLDANASRE